MIEWDADQRALRDGMAKWFDALNADRVEHDERAVFSWDTWKVIQQSGLLGLLFPQRFGGLGQSLLTTMYVFEGFGHGCRDSGLTFSATTSVASVGVPLDRFGTAEQQQRYLPGVCSGEIIGAHAITEPQGGSDALRMLATAERDGDTFVLNGTKTFITNGPIADVYTIYARTRPDAGPLGVTAFLVERGTPGLLIGEPMRTMGLRTSPIGTLTLEDCRVPASQVVGRVGSGFLVLDHVMKREILLAFILDVGHMRHRLERTIGYARQRSQFGRPIGQFQTIANVIVDMKIRLETARKWLYDAAERLERGENATADIAIAKLVTSEANLASSLAAMQVFGGKGYLTEHGIEQDIRDAVGGRIYSGSNEIQYNRIASMLGL
ncbi:acyl-CoA dehydrogenase family protein [Dactylosporangium sp. NPDC048998]|uniref:acyl-CoA dehydrogenase family protein n=1 Tax=Dactylosporangium sp. NPDC048998 TaxID=3363976 RepID=UPI00372086AF